MPILRTDEYARERQLLPRRFGPVRRSRRRRGQELQHNVAMKDIRTKGEPSMQLDALGSPFLSATFVAQVPAPPSDNQYRRSMMYNYPKNAGLRLETAGPTQDVATTGLNANVNANVKAPAAQPAAVRSSVDSSDKLRI